MTPGPCPHLHDAHHAAESALQHPKRERLAAVHDTAYEPATLPDGVSQEGQTALLAQAVNAVVDPSITNFTNNPHLCQTPVEK